MESGFLACLAGAVLMGASCGTGCSPAISLFLSGYIFHAEGDTKRSLLAFLKFFAGKALAVIIVCMAASAAGVVFVETTGYFGKYRLKYLMPAFLILTGIYMLYKCLREHRSKGCSSCHGHCHSRKDSLESTTPFIGGFLYGLTPCAPLILLAGYAVTMQMPKALILGGVFSVACMISPMVFMMLFLKIVTVKMKSEVPSFFDVVKAAVSAGILVMGIVTCVTGIEPVL